MVGWCVCVWGGGGGSAVFVEVIEGVMKSPGPLATRQDPTTGIRPVPGGCLGSTSPLMATANPLTHTKHAQLPVCFSPINLINLQPAGKHLFPPLFADSSRFACRRPRGVSRAENDQEKAATFQRLKGRLSYRVRPLPVHHTRTHTSQSARRPPLNPQTAL